MSNKTLAVVLFCTLAATARADNKEVARQAYQEGARQYDLGDFKAALEAFKKAYLNYEEPAFLYNIAQCERQLGDKAEALRTYRVFLKKVPTSRERPQIEKIIAELQAAIDQDKAVKARPPTETVEPPIAKSVSTTPSPEPVISPSTSTPQVTEQSSPEKKSIAKKGWFWGVLAGGAVVIAGAVAIGVVYGTPHRSYIELTY